MSIGINAVNLATEGLEIELPGGAGGRIFLVLGQSGGLTGRYEQDGGQIGLRKLAAHQFSIQKLELPLAGGTLRVDTPAILSGLALDAQLGGGSTSGGHASGGHAFEGQGSVASAAAELVFERGPLLVRAALHLEQAQYEQSGAGRQRGELDGIELRTLRLEVEGRTLVEVERLVLSSVRFELGHGGVFSIACGSALANEVVIEQNGRVLQLTRLAFPAGIELEGGRLRWPELRLERVAARVPELPRRASRPAPPRASSERTPLDLGWLDELSGLLAFDLLLDVRLPILPDRRATHSIRVPIEQGTINFKRLESCLATLENTLFDFEVTDEGLIFELDPIPGLSVDNVTLVTWPLSGHEHQLAKHQQKIRLRRLLDYQLSPKLTSSGESRSASGNSGLRRLHVGNIETVLGLGGPTELPLPGLGQLRLGAPGAPALRELRLSGQLEHNPGEPPAATELRVDAQELTLGLAIHDGAGRRVSAERLAIQRIDGARLGLLGLEPRSLSVNAEGIRLLDVELRGWFGKHAGV